MAMQHSFPTEADYITVNIQETLDAKCSQVTLGSRGRHQENLQEASEQSQSSSLRSSEVEQKPFCIWRDSTQYKTSQGTLSPCVFSHTILAYSLATAG